MRNTHQSTSAPIWIGLGMKIAGRRITADRIPNQREASRIRGTYHAGRGRRRTSSASCLNLVSKGRNVGGASHCGLNQRRRGGCRHCSSSEEHDAKILRRLGLLLRCDHLGLSLLLGGGLYVVIEAGNVWPCIGLGPADPLPAELLVSLYNGAACPMDRVRISVEAAVGPTVLLWEGVIQGDWRSVCGASRFFVEDGPGRVGLDC